MEKKEKKHNVFFCAFIVLAVLVVQASSTCASTGPVIVILSNRDATPYHQLQTAFEKNLLQKYPDAELSFFLLEKDKAKRTAILKSAKQKLPNMVLALGTSSTHEAVKVFPNTPVVASMVINNDAFAYADKVTGVLLQISSQVHFQWLSRFLPNNKRVGILYNPQQNKQWIDDAGKYAGRFGLNLVAIAVNSAKDLPNALKKISRKADVLIGIPDQTIYSSKTAKMVLLFSYRNKIPFIGLSKSWVKAGALYSLEWDYGAVGRQCAIIAEKILSGTAPDDIPVQSMTDDIFYSINKRTARHLKLDIDEIILDDAAFVFE